MGWQDLHPQIRRAYQSKGGSVKKPKGFAVIDKNRHLELSSLGGKNKRENTSYREANISKESDSNSPRNLEDLLGILDEQVQE